MVSSRRHIVAGPKMITLDALYLWVGVLTLITSAIGVVMAGLGLADAMAQQRVAYTVGNGARIIVSAGHVRVQGVILSSQVILLMIAVISLALPAPPVNMPLDVLQLLTLRKALRLGLSALLCLSTILDWRDRQRLEPFVRG